jgi:hypothetical protein
MEDLLAVQTVHNQHRSEKTRSSWEKINTPMQQKAFFKLSGFQYKICYKKGTTNLVADAMSRRHHTGSVCAISAVQPKWLEIIVE